MRKLLRVEPGTGADLARRATDDRLGLVKEAADDELARLTARLSTMQQRLFAEDRRSLLLVLQGLDAAGKDGTIRRVFTGLNPQGCRVASFKAPSDAERGHDYLWRIHAALPERGQVGIFNRSHYEDLVTAVVLGVIDDRQRKQRYEHARAFEQYLADEGTTMVKVFLNISRDEQKSRLEARLADPEKRWKFRRSDLEARNRWDEYIHHYDQALTHTSTAWAPWYVVPADRKWVSAIAVARILVDALEDLDPKIPLPAEGLDGIEID